MRSPVKNAVIAEMALTSRAIRGATPLRRVYVKDRETAKRTRKCCRADTLKEIRQFSGEITLWAVQLGAPGAPVTAEGGR
jgi:hypothetical protein